MSTQSLNQVTYERSSPMKIVLLGASGKLGSSLIRLSERTHPRITWLCVPQEQLDLAQREQIVPVLGEISFDVLINCAAHLPPDLVEHEAQQAFAVNSWALAELARLCHMRRARLIHISTDFVFDGRSSSPYSEQDNTYPLNVYGASKVMGEALSMRYHDDVVIARTASLFGAVTGAHSRASFVDVMLKLGRQNGYVQVMDDLLMSPSFCDDVASMLLGLLKAPPGTYHLVNSGQASWHEFACAIFAMAGMEVQVEPIASRDYPGTAVRPSYSVLDNRKVSALVGTPSSWQDALERYLKEHD